MVALASSARVLGDSGSSGVPSMECVRWCRGSGSLASCAGCMPGQDCLNMAHKHTQHLATIGRKGHGRACYQNRSVEQCFVDSAYWACRDWRRCTYCKQTHRCHRAHTLITNAEITPSRHSTRTANTKYFAEVARSQAPCKDPYVLMRRLLRQPMSLFRMACHNACRE